MPFGLVRNVYGGSSPFRLDGVNLKACVNNLTYSMTAELKHVNTSSEVVEGTFVFPVGDIAIYYFRATIEGREVISECRPRSEAKATYDEAIEAGHAAFLSEQDEQCEDMFQISIGNVPANATVVILLKYVGHLEAENVKHDSGVQGRVTMTLPQVLNPRYSPIEAVERQFEAFEDAVTTAKYKITFTATLAMPHEITGVDSAKDKYKVQFNSEDHRMGEVTLSDEFVADHDLQMCINLKKELSSCVAIGRCSKSNSGIFAMPCLMIQFMPDFTAFADKRESRTELVFVIDRSGSMSGSRINYAKDALLLFLKSLPKQCRFQIIGFGSTHKSLFPEPVDYTESSLAKALKYQELLAGDMGGTEVYGALKAAIDAELSGKGWYREIIFLTDGDVGNANEVIGLVRSNVNKARLFAVGIGEGASTHLVSGVAKAGRGRSVFLRDGSQLQSAVSKILNTALEPRASDVQVEVKTERRLVDGKMEPVPVVLVPKQVPPILSGCFNTTYALLKTDCLEDICGTATVKFDIGGQEQTVSLDLARHLESGCVVDSEDQVLHRLAGKCQINELTQEYNAIKCPDGKKADDAKGKELREQVVKLSCQLNILSIFTALIGVDPKKQDPQKPAIPDKSRERYVRLGSSGTSHLFSKGAAVDCVDSAFAAPMACAFAAPMASVQCMQQSSLERTVSTRKRDTFTELVALQQFNGWWVLDTHLATCVGIEQKKLEDSKPKEWSVSLSVRVAPDVWATALAVAFFEVAFAARQTDWTLVVSKAIDWLKEAAEKAGASSQSSAQMCHTLIQVAKDCLIKEGLKPVEAN